MLRRFILRFPAGTLLVFLTGVSLATWSGPATALTMPEAFALIEAGRANEAYQVLKPQEAQRAGNPDFDTALGLAALDSGHPDDAVNAFERVLAVQPDNAPVRAELARAYTRLGDLETARQQLAIIQASGVPADVGASLGNYAAELDRELSGGAAKHGGYVELTAGYDTNINASRNDDTLVIPAFAALGPSTLSGGAVARDDWFVEAAVGGYFSNPLSLEWSGFGNVVASYRHFFNYGTYDQTALTAEAGITRHTPDQGDFTLALQGSASTFNGALYRNGVTGLGRWKRAIDDRSEVSVFTTLSYLNYLQDDARDAWRTVIGASVQHAFAAPLSPVATVTVYGGLEKTFDAAADHESHGLAGIRTTLEAMLGEHLTGFAQFSYEHRQYHADYPLFLTPRTDNVVTLTGGLNQRLGERTTLRPTVSYTRSHSNVGLFDYDRWVGSLTLRQDF